MEVFEGGGVMIPHDCLAQAGEEVICVYSDASPAYNDILHINDMLDFCCILSTRFVSV